MFKKSTISAARLPLIISLSGGEDLFGGNIEDPYMMLTVVLAVMGTVTSVSLGIHDCDRDPFRNSEFISADSKDWVDGFEHQTLICCCDCKVCLAESVGNTLWHLL